MSKPQVEGHWHSLIEGFATSSLDFYELVKAGIAKREIPDLKISQVEWKQGGLGSGKRTYLRVSREGLNFDICAAPFGTGYFFSWWLARISRVLLDFSFIFVYLIVGFMLYRAMSGDSQNGEPSHGCAGVFLTPLIFFGLLLGLGFLVRYGDMGAEPTVLSMPITGFFYGLVFRPQTYFNEDTAIMFRESVHHAVLEAIDQVTTAQGVRGLSEEARRITFQPGGKR
ncbi:MAG TPA: hypothetical protein VKU44_02910 [Terriglobia bacterium]|nr:hypothetical protein [Terriglobia bacterium]